MDLQIPNILLLCENETAAQLERRALRDAGFPVSQILTSGVEAARLLAGLTENKEKPDIVVCTQKLDDMDGEQFCAIIRQHPLLLGFPVLLVMPNDSEADQLRTLGCGASALLGRPYSLEKLKSHMTILKSAIRRQKILKTGATQIDTSAFDTALATYGILLRPDRDPEDYFRVGMRCLEEHRWNLAISAFEHALRHAQVKAEAQLGMAAAFKGKGEIPKMREWLGEATRTFVAAHHWHHARAAYAKLLRHDPNARNPFITEAHQLIRQKKYDEAASVLVQGIEVLSPEDAGHRYAKVCFTADDPQAMLKALEAGFLRQNTSGADIIAEEIRQSLAGLAREREQRQRELAAERKWRLSRAMPQKEKTTAPAVQKPVELLQEKTVNLFEEPDLNDYLEEEMENGGKAGMQILPPLSESEATSDLFEKKPRLNELLSVIKLTWKLARNKKKN